MTEQRRALVRWLLGGGVLSSVSSFVYPVLQFIMPPAVPEAAIAEVGAGKIQDWRPDTARIVKFGTLPVILIRVTENEWRAFSAVCTHLNCTVQYRQEGQQIWCACHNGFYDLNGKVVAGPPPKPLEEFQVRFRGEEVFVTRRS